MAQSASVRTIPAVRSTLVVTAPSSTAVQKLGQPVPESYFVSEVNSAVSHTTQR